MKQPPLPLVLRMVLAGAVTLGTSAAVNAASATWTGLGANGNFTDAANWTPGVPGVVGGGATTDTATFNNAVNTDILVDADRTLSTISFEAGSGGFRFSGGPLLLLGTNDVTLAAGVANSQTFLSNVTAASTNSNLAFVNSSTVAGVVVNVFGDIAARPLGGSVNMNGVGAGAIVRGRILDNGTGATGLAKDFNSTFLVLRNGESSYSGATTLTRGTTYFDAVATVGGGNSSFGAVTTTTSGTFQIGSSTSADVMMIYTGDGHTTDRALNLVGAMGLNLTANGSGALVWNGNLVSAAANTHNFTLSGYSNAENQFGGIIANSSNAGQATSVIKAGTGVWNLTAANTYTGTTAVSEGLLRLDFAAASAPATNLVSASSILAMEGGTFAVRGKTSGATSQTMNGLSLTAGSSRVAVDGNGGGGTVLNVGAITRSGVGTVLDVSLASSGTFLTSTTTTTNGVLSSGDVAYATVNGSDWATVSGGAVSALSSYQTGSNPAGWAATDNVSLSGSPIANVSTQTINTLRVTDSSTFTIGSGNTLTLGAGGLLFTGTGTTLVTGGTLRGSGGTTKELVVFQNQTAGSVEIASSIANNTTATSLTKAGAGTLKLSGSNSFTGSVTVTEGVLLASTANSYTGQYLVLAGGVLGLGAGDYAGTVNLSQASNRLSWTNSGGFAAYGADRSVTLNGGAAITWGSTAFVGNNDALLLGADDADGKIIWTNALSLNTSTSQSYVREIRVADGSASVDGEMSGVISTGALSHGGILKTGAGTLLLSAANTYDGPTWIAAGTLLVNGSIGNSILTTVADGGTLAGTGIVAQLEIMAGGVLAPGDGGIGTLSTSQNGNSDLIWNGEEGGSFAQMRFDLSASSNASDLMDLGNGLLLQGSGDTFVFDFMGSGGSGFTYTLMEFAATDFTVDDFGYTNLGSGLTGSFVLNADNLQFVVSAIPEPGSALLLLGGVALLGLRRRRA